MISIAFISFFTIAFFISKIKFRLLLLMFSVFVLPFFYAYFPFLPNETKLITDIFFLLFFLEMLVSKRIVPVVKYNKLSLFLFIYTIVFLIIVVFSSIANDTNLLLVLLEIRKIVFPFFIVCIFNYYEQFKTDTFDFEFVLKLVFILQCIVIPIQYLMYDYYSQYMVTSMGLIDTASGTFGIGTSMVGVFIVLYFIYYFMITNSISSFYSLLPLPFVSSGGANLLLVVSLSLALLLGRFNRKMVMKLSLGSFIVIIIAALSSGYIFDRNPIIDSYEYISKGFEKTTRENKIFTDNSSAGKLSRLYGPVYAVDQLSSYHKEITGFGPAAYGVSTSLDITSNLFDIGEIINLVPELLLKYGYPGLFANLIFYTFLVIYFFRKRYVNKYYAISFVFGVVYLLDFMYTKPIYQQVFNFFVFYIYFKAHSLEKDEKVNDEKSIYNNTYIQTTTNA